jgi:hypothetical protein
MVGFIFGGKDTPWTYDELQQKRKMAEALAASNLAAPKNVGEGLNAIGRALMYRNINKKANTEESRMRDEFDAKWGAVLGGGSSYAAPTGNTAASGGQPPAPLSEEAKLAGDTMAALGKGGHDHATAHPGVSHGDWLKYSNQGAVRNDPLDPALIKAMSFLPGMGITMDVVSGGQEAAGEGGARTGSTRHDHGKAGDVDFYKDGRKLDWNNPGDLPILQEVVRTAKSRGVTGIGAGDDYMGAGRFHIGFGAPAVWGAGGSSANAPAWLVEAYSGAPSGAAPAVSATAGAAPAGFDIGSLVALASDPMASPAQRGIVEALINQQMSMMDPLRQIEMQKAQIELAQMQNPDAKPVELKTFTGPDGVVYSMNPYTGETTALTGAEQPEPGARPLTDPAERAQWGIPSTDTRPYAIEPGKQPELVGDSKGTTVSVGGEETQFDKTIGEANAKAYDEIVKGGVSASTGMGTLDAMEAAMADPNFYSGTGAGVVEALRRGAVSMGIADAESVTSMESFNALAKNAALTAMGGSLGAGFSNADRDFVERQVPTLGNTPEGNREIIRIQKALLRRKQEVAQLAVDYASRREAEGKRFDQAGFEAEARKFAEANPLFGEAPKKAGGNTTSSGIQWSIE